MLLQTRVSLFSYLPVSLLTYYYLDEVDWDVARFAERVKNTRPRPDGEPALEDVNLAKYFTTSELGDLDEPSTIVDKFGQIIVWYLPGMFFACLIVSPSCLLFVTKNNLPSSQDAFHFGITQLRKQLIASLPDAGSGVSALWRKQGFQPGPLFGSGVLDLSPAWFQAAHIVSSIYYVF